MEGSSGDRDGSHWRRQACSQPLHRANPEVSLPLPEMRTRGWTNQGAFLNSLLTELRQFLADIPLPPEHNAYVRSQQDQAPRFLPPGFDPNAAQHVPATAMLQAPMYQQQQAPMYQGQQQLDSSAAAFFPLGQPLGRHPALQQPSCQRCHLKHHVLQHRQHRLPCLSQAQEEEEQVQESSAGRARAPQGQAHQPWTCHHPCSGRGRVSSQSPRGGANTGQVLGLGRAFGQGEGCSHCSRQGSCQ